MSRKYVDNRLIDASSFYILSALLLIMLPPLFMFKIIYNIFKYRAKERNMRGKVVLITGASSGIGEYMAYEYAKKGALLSIVARREDRLQKVAERARELGSPDVITISADVSNFNDCRRFVDQTVNHFGRLDHLVNNAGIGNTYLVNKGTEITKCAPVMDINFWGSVYATYFAIPHLKKTKGKIVVNSSIAAYLGIPSFAFYAASKSALESFYDSIRAELGPEITITIATLGFVDSEMSHGKLMNSEGLLQHNQGAKDRAMSRKYVDSRFVDAASFYMLSVLLLMMLPPLFLFKVLYNIIFKYRAKESNMIGKVVLITGASSGIGEYLAYEYAKRGAFLSIVARREDRLQKVSETARELGSPDVITICADVSKFNDCKRFVDKTVDHFGRLDHLVNNAGISNTYVVSEGTEITKFSPVMDINFWGSVYATYFAIPHLKKTKGKIIVNSSTAAYLNLPSLGFYAASKSALISFYDSLRVELGSDVTITIVTLGLVESELTMGKVMGKQGMMQHNQPLKDVVYEWFGLSLMSTRPCAEAIVSAACRGDRYLTEPKLCRVLIIFNFLFPEFVPWNLLKPYLSKLQADT